MATHTTRGLSDHTLVYTCIPFQLCASASCFSSFSSASILYDSAITTTTTLPARATPPHTTTTGDTSDRIAAKPAPQTTTFTAPA